MNEHIEVTPVSESLSDGSKVWNVRIQDEDGNAVCVECLSEKAAIQMASRVKDIFTEGGAAA